MEDLGKSISKNPKEYLIFLKAHADQITKKLKENNISVTSTIAIIESLPKQRFALKSRLKEIKLRYANPKIIEGTALYKLGWLTGRSWFEYNGEDKLKQENCH